MMYFALLAALIAITSIALTQSASVTIDIYYPENGLNFTSIDYFGGAVFTINVYSSCMENHLDEFGEFTFGTDVCPGGEFSRDSNFIIYNPSDRISSNRNNEI